MSVPFTIPSPIPAAFRAAFPTTIPIFTGFWFLGITYGAYMVSLGFAWYYPTLMALVIFAGSLEFLIAGALVSAFHPPTSTAAGSCSSLPLSTMPTGFPAP